MTTTPAPIPPIETANSALAAMALAHSLADEAINAASLHDVAAVSNLLLQIQGTIERAERLLCALDPEALQP